MVEEDKIPYLPVNYSSISWVIKNWWRENITPYSKINAATISLEELVLSIINHFDICTTLDIAEELMAFYDMDGEPNALFTAKVFNYLLSMKKVVISSKAREF